MKTHLDTYGIQHLARCAGGGITRRDGIEHSLIACTGCGKSAMVPLRRDWTDNPTNRSQRKATT